MSSHWCGNAPECPSYCPREEDLTSGSPEGQRLAQGHTKFLEELNLTQCQEHSNRLIHVRWSWHSSLCATLFPPEDKDLSPSAPPTVERWFQSLLWAEAGERQPRFRKTHAASRRRPRTRTHSFGLSQGSRAGLCFPADVLDARYHEFLNHPLRSGWW